MSFDAIAATFLFLIVAVFAAIYAYNYFTSSAGTSLSDEAATVSSNLLDQLSTGTNGSGQARIDLPALVNVINESKHGAYYSIKTSVGATQDFCIFFEDQSGHIVSVVNSTTGTQTRAVFGSSAVRFTNGTATKSDDISCATGSLIT